MIGHFSVRRSYLNICTLHETMAPALCLAVLGLKQEWYKKIPYHGCWWSVMHYSDVIMGLMASQITSFTIVYSTAYSGPNQRKHQSSASLPFVRGIHRWPVNFPHKWPVTRQMFPFYDVNMDIDYIGYLSSRLPLRWIFFKYSFRNICINSIFNNYIPDDCTSVYTSFA